MTTRRRRGATPARRRATRARRKSCHGVPARVEIAVESDLGGVLALHSTWYPGWVAEIDGKRTPILRANVLFLAVEVPPGLRRVVFHYEPFALENLAGALKAALGRR